MFVMASSVVLLDYASQAAINPCESLVADLNQLASGSIDIQSVVAAVAATPSTIGSSSSASTDDGYFVYSSMLRYLTNLYWFWLVID
jgi:hypothetical protein